MINLTDSNRTSHKTKNHSSKAKILSVGTFLPDQRVRSDSILEEIQSDRRYGLPSDWLSSDMGINERRMAPDCFKPSDLAIPAARDALEACPHLDPRSIDAVIFCGIERDQPEPATAHTIQNELGLQAHHVFDVANACFGFVDGLKIAVALIESKVINYALVVTGETSTKILKAAVDRLKKGLPLSAAKNIFGALSLGDAGGAIILARSEHERSGFQVFNQRCDSTQVKRCHYEVRGDGSIDGQMQMAHIVARGFKLNKAMFDETLELLGWSGLDWALTHQTGKRTYQQVLTLKSINEENAVRTYPELANITTATLPMGLKKLYQSGNLKKGDRIGGLFAGSGLVSGQFGYVV